MERLDENISLAVGHRMSNTLALQDLLARSATGDQAAAQIILELEQFADRYQNGNYQLANEADLRPALLERALKEIFEPRSPEPVVCDYRGVEELGHDRWQQLRIFRDVRRSPLSFLLEQF